MVVLVVVSFEKPAATLLAVGRVPTVLLAGQPLLAAAAAGPAVPAMANRVVVAVTAARLTASTRIRLKILKPMFLFPPSRFLCPAVGMRQAARKQIRFTPSSFGSPGGGHLVNHRPGPPTELPPGSAAESQAICQGIKVHFTAVPKVGADHKAAAVNGFPRSPQGRVMPGRTR